MWKVELARELKDASPKHRSAILVAYERSTGKSRGQLYRIAKEHGFSSGRSSRSDKGSLRSDLANPQVEFVSALLHVTGRENKGPIMPVERALEIAEDNGIIEHGQVTTATMSRILRDRRLSARHLKAQDPHTEMRSLHPNHVHVFDVSVCIQYYLKDGRMGFMDERDFYKNKPHNLAKIKLRLLRYVIVDHFSGAFYFRYYNTTGETQNNLYDFLLHAWAHKEDEQYPFRGVPFQILMDTGAANTAKAILAFLERLDVQIPKGLPYNPTRQGSVETMHNIIERWFETGLRVHPAATVEQLNEWAEDFTVYHNANKNHTRHGMTRTQCWVLIKREQLRELPPEDILHDLYANPEEERTVDGTYRISFRGKEYNLKHVEGLFRGAKVKAVLKPFKWPQIDVVYNDMVYEAAPLERLPAHQGAFSMEAAVIGREYKAPPETVTQEAKKQFENMAFGEKRKKDAVPFEGLTVHGIHAEKVGNIAFIPREGIPLEVDRGITDRRISFMDFLKRLRAEAGTISRELNTELRAEFGDSIDTKKAEEVIAQIKGGRWPEADDGRQVAEAI